MQNVDKMSADVSNIGSQQSQNAGIVLNATSATDKDVGISDRNVYRADSMQSSANFAYKKYMDAIAAYQKRSDPSSNKYANKSVVLADGTSGYVNNLGYFQKYENKNNTLGKNNCPSAKSGSVRLGVNNMSGLTNIMGDIVLGDQKPSNTACGYEGDTVFVGRPSFDVPATYEGCYNFTYNAFPAKDAMTKNNGAHLKKASYDDCRKFAISKGKTMFGIQRMAGPNNESFCWTGDNFQVAKNAGPAKGIEKTSVIEAHRIPWRSIRDMTNTVRWRYFYVGNSRRNVKTVRVPNGYVLGELAINGSSSRYGDRFRVYQGRWDSAGKGKTLVKVKRVDSRGGWGMTLRLPLFMSDVALDRNLKFMRKNSKIMRRNARRGRYRLRGRNDLGSLVPSEATLKSGRMFFYKNSNSGGKVVIENFGSPVDPKNGPVFMELVGLNEGKAPGLYMYQINKQKRRRNILTHTPSSMKTAIDQVKSPDPNIVQNAKYVGKMTDGDTLRVNEYIVSRDGRLGFRYVAAKESGKQIAKIQFFTKQLNNPCVKLPSGQMSTTNTDSIAVYTLPVMGAGGGDDIGRIGYVDGNGELHPYDLHVLTPTNTYNTNMNETVEGSNRPNMPVNTSESSCKSKCSRDNSCFGYVYERQSNTCYLKDRGILRTSSKPASGTVTGVRDVTLDKNVIGDGCKFTNLRTIDSETWQSFPVGDTMKRGGCDYDKFLNTPELQSLKREWEKTKDQAEKEQRKLDTSEVNAKMDIQAAEHKINTDTSNANEYIYQQTIQKKIPSSMTSTSASVDNIEAFTGNIKKTAKKNPQPDLAAPSQRSGTVAFKNINAIVNDSVSVVTQNSAKFFMWSAITTIVAILSFRLINKMRSSG